MILDENLFETISIIEARKKKRRKNKLSLKGFGWWPIYIDDEDHNCGNMEYNNAMFNKMMGSADYTSTDVGDDGDGVGVGMGESFIVTPKSEKLDISNTLKDFINKNQDLINNGEWEELFVIADRECLSWRDQGVLIHILEDAGVIRKDDF